jgi:hypothetical protein
VHSKTTLVPSVTVCAAGAKMTWGGTPSTDRVPLSVELPWEVEAMQV